MNNDNLYSAKGKIITITAKCTDSESTLFASSRQGFYENCMCRALFNAGSDYEYDENQEKYN